MSTSTVAVNNKRKLTLDDRITHPRKHLRIEIPPTIPTSTASATLSSTTLSPSSLFSVISLTRNGLETSSLATLTTRRPALLTAPPIPGLYFTPNLEIPADLADSIISFCMSTYFRSPDINQIMLFTRFSPQSTSSLPPVLIDLLDTLSNLLHPHIPEETHALLFPRTPTQARQVILNLYTPGEGISPHVDLLKRFGDGIIGVSLGSGCVMRFAKASISGGGNKVPSRTSILDEPIQIPDTISSPNEENKGDERREDGNSFDLFLPERSILVLSADARYKWTHEIEKCKSDYVSQSPSCVGSSPLSGPPVSKGRWIDRGIRLSVTYRWLLPGADIVGNDEESGSEYDSELP